MIGQQYATTGLKRFTPSYTADINARTPYLPNLYNLKSENAYREKAMDQDNKQFQLNFMQNEQARKDAKKRNNWATAISLGGLGVSSGLGAYNAGLFDFGGDPVSESVSNAAGNFSDLFQGSGNDDLWSFSDAADYVSEPVADFAVDLGSQIYDAGSEWVGSLI